MQLQKKKNECPLKDSCLTYSVVYKARVSTELDKKLTLARRSISLKEKIPQSQPILNTLKMHQQHSTLQILLGDKVQEHAILYRMVRILTKASAYTIETNQAAISA